MSDETQRDGNKRSSVPTLKALLILIIPCEVHEVHVPRGSCILRVTQIPANTYKT